MGEVGCLKDGVFQNLQVEGSTNLGVTHSKWTDFMTGNTNNLSATPAVLTDAEVDAGVTGGDANIAAALVVANALNTSAWTSASAAGEIYLPTPTVNMHLAIHFIAATSAGNAVTFTATEAATGAFAGTSGTFAYQQVGPLFGGGVAASACITAVSGTGAAGTQAGTTTKLVYTPSSSTSFLGIGSVMHFYCIEDGEWFVRVFNVPTDTGATGAFSI